MRAQAACLCAFAALGVAAPLARAQTFGSPYHFTEQGGFVIYTAICASCHMTDGRGARGAGAYPSLNRDQRLATVAYPIDILLLGQKAMPAFARTLSDQQIADVANYLRTHFGNAYTGRATPADVAAARK